MQQAGQLQKIRILVADDHAAVRDGMRRLLQKQPDLEVIGLAGDGQEAVEQALRLQPDVIVMDIGMPRLTGIEATRQIRLRAPHVHIIGWSMHEKSDMAATMRAAGANEYLPKTCPPQELLAAIRQYPTA